MGLSDMLGGSDEGTDLVELGEDLGSSGVPDPCPGSLDLFCFCCVAFLYAVSVSFWVNTVEALVSLRHVACRYGSIPRTNFLVPDSPVQSRLLLT